MSAARTFRARTFAALRVRNFRLYFIGQLISISGTWMQSVAQGWLVLQITGSSVDLGIAVALQFLPTLLVGSYGGLIADRFEKRRILYFTQSGAGLLALALGLLVSNGHVTLSEVYAIALGLGVVNLFDTPARQAFVQQMVGRDLIANAVSLNSVLMNAGRLVGPGIATALIATLGTAACFYANAGSFLAVLVALWMMRASDFVPMRTVTREKGQLRLGLRYAVETPMLRNVLLVVTLLGTFAYNFTVTLPLLARVTFHEHTATQYGILMGAMGLGAVVGGLTVAYRSRPTMELLAFLALGFGVSMNLTALSPSIHLAQLALVPTGAFSIAMMSTANALLQLNSKEHMRGRVMSLYSIAFLGTTPIGAPLMGLIASASNPRVAISVGATLALVTGVLLMLGRRATRRHEGVLTTV
ncbi:MAG TPA: MFS transporter [Acidimicrobiales bacterium]